MQVTSEIAERIFKAIKRDSNNYSVDNVKTSFELAFNTAFNYEEKIKVFLDESFLTVKVKNITAYIYIEQNENGSIHIDSPLNISYKFKNISHEHIISSKRLTFNAIVEEVRNSVDKYKYITDADALRVESNKFAKNVIKQLPVKILADKVSIKANNDNTYKLDFSNLNKEELQALLIKLGE